MEEKPNVLMNACNFMDVKPIMMALPYPPVQIKEKNSNYAHLLHVNYCGSVSEMSAIMQYVNNTHRLSMSQCLIAKTILGIAMAEMIHLQKLGELIVLLGGNVDYSIKQRDGKVWTWTPHCLTLEEHPKKILMAAIASEKAAINQYMGHIKIMNDEHIRAMLKRIIQDEKYHIMVLQALMNMV